MRTFYEFFAGGGMARSGLGPQWRCLFANDINAKKATSYRANWGGDHFFEGDVADLTPDHLVGDADLAWASFPCQDLSLAGPGAGLSGARSGAFHPFWNLVLRLRDQGRAPAVIVLENVVGALTSGKGRDFVNLARHLRAGGYRFGAVVIDATYWVPQSRPRLFIVAVDREIAVDSRLKTSGPDPIWHSPALVAAARRFLAADPDAGDDWVWWKLPAPPTTRDRFQTLADLIEPDPIGVAWHAASETDRLLAMMSPRNRDKVHAAELRARSAGERLVGAIYRRTRPTAARAKVQRAEVRFDGVAGCLRTPGGGSSRQTILVVEPNRVRSRLLSPREAARLMGLADDYVLPRGYNDAYHLTGDGVVVNVVRFLARGLLEPLLSDHHEITVMTR